MSSSCHTYTHAGASGSKAASASERCCVEQLEKPGSSDMWLALTRSVCVMLALPVAYPGPGVNFRKDSLSVSESSVKCSEAGSTNFP